MDQDSQRRFELQALRSLCDNMASDAAHQSAMHSLERHNFVEPEHEIVFQSLRALWPRGPVSAERLRVHLTNRGFPDTDVEKYFNIALAQKDGQSLRSESDK